MKATIINFNPETMTAQVYLQPDVGFAPTKTYQLEGVDELVKEMMAHRKLLLTCSNQVNTNNCYYKQFKSDIDLIVEKYRPIAYA